MRINCAVSVVIYISCSHIIATALPWAYGVFGFTQHGYVSAYWHCRRPVSEPETFSAAGPAACSITTFTFPRSDPHKIVLPIIHCFGTWQKKGKPCQCTYKHPSFKVVDLKQLYFSSVLVPWCCTPTWMLRCQANTPSSIRKGSLWRQLLWNLLIFSHLCYLFSVKFY